MTQQTIYSVEGESLLLKTAVASAQATFKFFCRELSWEQRRIVKGLDLAAVKISLRLDSDDPDIPAVENIWVTDVEFDGHTLHGVLINHPHWATSMSAGDPVSVPVTDLNDWIYVLLGRVYGGFTIDALRAGMTDQERAEHDQAWGLDFGELNCIELAAPAKNQPALRFTRALDSDADRAGLETLARTEHPMCSNLLERIDEDLRQHPELISDRDEAGWTLLHHEALAGNHGLVRALLRHGADPQLRTHDGDTPLSLARRAGWPQMVELLEGGADGHHTAEQQGGFPLWPIGMAMVLAALVGLYYVAVLPVLNALKGSHSPLADTKTFVALVLLLGMGLVSCTGPWYWRLRERTPICGKCRALDLVALVVGGGVAILLREQLRGYV